MALPVILVNSASGSDAAASGAGPATALSGTGNAATDGAGTTVTLPAGTNLSGVATDGSHVLFLNDATAGARNFGKVTGTAGSGGATPTVTVANAFGLSLTNKDWAIGGKRASVGSATSKKLLENNGGAGDAMPGWAVEMESGHAETLAAGWTFRRSGDPTTDGAIVLRGASGAATMPLLTHSANAAFIVFGNNVNYIQLLDFEAQNTNATKTASVAVNQTGGSSVGVVVRGLRIAHATNKFWRAVQVGQFGSTFLVQRCEIGYTADNGIHLGPTTNNTVIRNNRIHHCNVGVALVNGGGSGAILENEVFANTLDGINRDTSVSSAGAYVVDRNTVCGNGGDGIDWGPPIGGSYNQVRVTNNILANNGGYGLNLSGTSVSVALLAGAGALFAGNQTFGNTLGACNLAGMLVGDTGLDPQFVSATDLRIGTNLHGTAYPTDNNPGTAYRGYADPGANEPQYATDYPAAGNVRLGTAYNFGALVGTVKLPAADKVLAGEGYGAGGTEFTGTLTTAPVTINTVQVVRPPDPLPTGQNADDVHEALRRRLDDALPDDWAVVKRRDLRELPGDQYPRAVVVLGRAQVLQEETDNRALVLYPATVALLVNEATVERTDEPLAAVRRTAQRAVYTTDYPGLAVEEVQLSEDPSEPLPTLDEGVTAAGFTVGLGVLEDREDVPA